MRLGIVGSEQAKFTPETEEAARRYIRTVISMATLVVSGECHLGGVDIFIKEEAKRLNIPYHGYPPEFHGWEAYKKRNIQITQNSDLVICITVRKLPPGYKEKGFEKYCYHCKTDTHIKSGGCWTVKYARSIGKATEVVVILRIKSAESK